MTTPTLYHCAICGRRARPEAMVYSRFTRSRYCAELDACHARGRRRANRPATDLATTERTAQ